MFIILTSYTVDVSQVEALLDEHLKWLKQHYETGVFIASGRKSPWNGSVILARGCSRAELDEILSADPFAARGLLTCDVAEVTFARARSDLAGLVES